MITLYQLALANELSVELSQVRRDIKVIDEAWGKMARIQVSFQPEETDRLRHKTAGPMHYTPPLNYYRALLIQERDRIAEVLANMGVDPCLMPHERRAALALEVE